MKQKRWILLEVPEEATEAKVEFFDDKAQVIYGEFFDDSDMHGPVELMQAACEVAGVKYTTPQKGDWFMYCDMTWHTSAMNPEDFGETLRLVIPADPEPCPNCQNVKPGYWVAQHYDAHALRCLQCNKPESEWTYVPEPEWAGVGSGIM